LLSIDLIRQSAVVELDSADVELVLGSTRSAVSAPA